MRMKKQRRAERGSLLLEAALVFPALVLAALALLQCALWAHTVNVVDDAGAYGVRAAAEWGGDPGSAAVSVRSLLVAGLGDYARSFAVRTDDLGDAVEVDVRGTIPILLPLPGAPGLPIAIHLVRPKDGARAD